ncbi:MAG TPA: glycine/sarcosine/betaine reductase complex component C subunit beta [Gaiellaceae bacterium]|nr:glycine/sarcosine/betaine reductase complex component C subunit beta [Gaiellaceae bacterium]
MAREIGRNLRRPVPELMSAAVHSCSLVLAHAPDLVRHGSKPTREDAAEQIAPRLRTFEEALGYPPHQVFLGNLRPEALWEIERPWWRHSGEAKREGPFGVFIDEEALYRRLEAADQFQLLRLDGREAADGSLPVYRNGDRAGAMLRAHDLDESLSASVLLENLACKTTGALALEHLLARTGFPADEVQYVIGSGEEAVGDRYQRGGGNLGKAIAEQAGCVNASGSDVKAFCAGPIHALVVAGSLVSSGVYDHVAVVAGGSLAKLGMKFAGALRHDVPVLEDVLAGLAILVGPAGDGSPTLRLDAVGRHRVGSGSAQQAVLEDLVVEPLERLGRKITDVDRFGTELHDPEITEPAGAGNVPQRNYKLMGALAVRRGEIPRDELDSFEREHGLPGFSPTQGHVASAVPWLPHGLAALRAGEIGSTMLVAKGSLFLGRMTELADGMSILLEPEG